MAEKISKLVITVDLQCHRCYKKIQKILCDLQEREKIKTISYDEAKNTVTISGPFDPQKLSKKLRCKACKVIKDIKIIEEEKKKDDSKGDKKKDGSDGKKEPYEIINDIKITVDLPKDLKEESKPKPPGDPKPKPKPKPVPCRPSPPCPSPCPPTCPPPCPPPCRPSPPCPPPCPPSPPCPPPCCRMPCHVPCPGGSQCCSCGNVCSGFYCPPKRPPCCGPSCGHCKICPPVCEEDPTICNIQ